MKLLMQFADNQRWNVSRYGTQGNVSIEVDGVAITVTPDQAEYIAETIKRIAKAARKDPNR